MDVREFLKYRSLSVDLTGNVNSVRKGYSPHELRSRFIGFEAEFEKIYGKWFGDVSEGLRGAICKDLDSVISEQERLVYAGLGNLGKQRWKNYIGGKPGSFLVYESAVFHTDEMRESQKLWPKKKSDAKASNSSNVGVAPEVGKIDSMLDVALGHIKSEPGVGKTKASGRNNQYYTSVTKTIYQNDTNFRVEYPKNKFEFFDYFEDAEEYWNACLEDLKSKS